MLWHIWNRYLLHTWTAKILKSLFLTWKYLAKSLSKIEACRLRSIGARKNVKNLLKWKSLRWTVFKNIAVIILQQNEYFVLESCQPRFIYYYSSPYFCLAALQYRTFLRALKHGFGFSCFRNLHHANSPNLRQSLERYHDAKLQAIFCCSDIIANVLACATCLDVFVCCKTWDINTTSYACFSLAFKFNFLATWLVFFSCFLWRNRPFIKYPVGEIVKSNLKIH